MKPKIIFFGSDKYSEIVLDAIKKDSRFRIIKIKNTADVGVLASYGKILPSEILAIPKHGILNIHPSLLPKYRGPSPVQTAILNGEKKTGVSIIKIDEKMDHGPIVAQFEEDIRPGDTAESLYFRLFEEGAKVLLTILPAYLKGRIELREQDHSQATFTRLLKKEDGFIPSELFVPKQSPSRGSTSNYKLSPYNLEPTPENLERFIRTMTPWPGAWTLLRLRSSGQAKRLKILKAHLEGGKLILDQVQLEGKKPVSWKQFQEGYPEAKLVS